YLVVMLLVRDYDRALRFYRDLLGFEMLFDTDLGNGYRHIRLQYPGFPELRLALDRPSSPSQEAAVGRQTGDTVWLGVPIRDAYSVYRRLSEQGVEFVHEPIELPYGIQLTALDPDGNRVGLFDDFSYLDVDDGPALA